MLYVHVKIQNEHYEYLTTKSIASSLNIPAPTVVKVIQKLNAANLLISKTGVDGGRSLANPISDITLYDVFVAVEQNNPLFKTHTKYNISGDVVDGAKANLSDAIQQAEDSMHDILKGISLMDLLR